MYTYLVVSTHQRKYDKCSQKAGGSALTARSHADFGHQRNESRVGVKRCQKKKKGVTTGIAPSFTSLFINHYDPH